MDNIITLQGDLSYVEVCLSFFYVAHPDETNFKV